VISRTNPEMEQDSNIQTLVPSESEIIHFSLRTELAYAASTQVSR
jgi:hypothetical protein